MFAFGRAATARMCSLSFSARLGSAAARSATINSPATFPAASRRSPSSPCCTSGRPFLSANHSAMKPNLTNHSILSQSLVPSRVSDIGCRALVGNNFDGDALALTQMSIENLMYRSISVRSLVFSSAGWCLGLFYLGRPLRANPNPRVHGSPTLSAEDPQDLPARVFVSR